MYENRNLPEIWKRIILAHYNDAIDRRFFDEPQRCDFCGRRINFNNSVTRHLGRGNFITTCLYHGEYNGQVVFDCMTGCKVSLFKEPRFYHEMVVIDELKFYIGAVGRFTKSFCDEFMLNVALSVVVLIENYASKEKKRLGMQ